MLFTRLLPLLYLLSLSSPSLSQDRQTPAVPKTCKPLCATTALSCETIPWSVLVRDRQVMDRPPRNRSVDRVRALHSQRSHVQAKAGFLATRI
jgi:hypothetical protein